MKKMTKNAAIDFPEFVQIQTVEACNCSCIICPYGHGFKPKHPKMPKQLFEKLIDEFSGQPKLKKIALELHNEPLLDKRFTFFIKLIKQKCKNVIVTTISNGRLITKALAEDLKKAGLDNIIISINATNDKIYRKIHGVSGYDKVIKNIDLLQNTGIEVVTSYLVLDLNMKLLIEFVKYWGKRKTQARWYTCSNRCGFLDKKKHLIIPKVKPVNCQIPFRSCVIACNGDVLACCQDWMHNLILGNIKSKSLREIWHGPKYKEFRKRFIRNPDNIITCKKCKLSSFSQDSLVLVRQLIEQGVAAFEFSDSDIKNNDKSIINRRSSAEIVPLYINDKYVISYISDSFEFISIPDEVSSATVWALESIIRTGTVSIHGLQKKLAECNYKGEPDDILDMLTDGGCILESD